MPGDKSISHRALILGALAVGVTRIRGLLEGEDVLNTAGAMRALGAVVERDSEGWQVRGRRRRRVCEPRTVLDFGNSGTGCRLVMGAVAGCPITATFDGDASLRAPADASRSRPAGVGRRPGDQRRRWRPAAGHACRRPRSDADRLSHAGPVGADQIRGAACRACCPRRHHRHRGGGKPRPHRTDAEALRRQISGNSRTARRKIIADRPAGTGPK